MLIQNPPDTHKVLFTEDELSNFINHISKEIYDIQDRLTEDLYNTKSWEDLLGIFKIIYRDLLTLNKRQAWNLSPNQEGKIRNDIKPKVVEIRGKVNGIIRLLKSKDNPEFEFKYGLSSQLSNTQAQLDELIEELLELKD